MASIYGAKSGNGWQLRLDYTVTQNVAANQSTVSMTLYLYANTTGSYNQEDNSAYYVIQGSRVYAKYSYNSPAWYTLGSRSVVIGHDADGSKKVTLSGEWVSNAGSSWTPDRLTVSGSVTLPTIPRASVPTAESSTVELGKSVKIYTNRKSNTYYHRIGVKFGSYTHWGKDVFDDDIAQNWFLFTPPLSLASQIPNAASGECTIYLRTYSSAAATTQVGSTQEMKLTLTVPSSLGPTASAGWCRAVAYNDGTKAEGLSVLLKGISRSEVSFDDSKVSCRQGASIKEKRITCQGETVRSAPYRTGVLLSTNVKVTCTVEDSRGFTVSEDLTLTAYDYSAPNLTDIAVYRCDRNGAAMSAGTHIWAQAKTSYTEAGGAITCQLKAYWKLGTSGSWGAAVSMKSGVGKIITGSTDILTTKTYKVRLEAVDTLGNSASYEAVVPTDTVAMHIREGGDGFAVGKYCERAKAFELPEDWEIVAYGDTLKKVILAMMWPVGSIYISVSATSPQTLFGGTWERIQDTFLLAAGRTYAAGKTGGEASHTLTTAEMPSHGHNPANQAGYYGFITNSQKAFTVGDMGSQSGSGRYYPYAAAAFDISRNTLTGTTGGGNSHNNMPPYLAVYVWKRTA